MWWTPSSVLETPFSLPYSYTLSSLSVFFLLCLPLSLPPCNLILTIALKTIHMSKIPKIVPLARPLSWTLDLCIYEPTWLLFSLEYPIDIAKKPTWLLEIRTLTFLPTLCPPASLGPLPFLLMTVKDTTIHPIVQATNLCWSFSFSYIHTSNPPINPVALPPTDLKFTYFFLSLQLETTVFSCWSII